MAKNSDIQWTDHTFNGWIGCTEISPACVRCYAKTLMDTRWNRVKWGAGQPRSRTSTANWKQPLRWNAMHDEFFATHNRRQRVFANSLSDVFDNEVEQSWRDELFGLIQRTPNLDWLVLTKRIGNVNSMVPRGLPLNVWLGATVANQEEAERDIPKLMDVWATYRFLSCEPLLGPIDFSYIDRSDGMTVEKMPDIDWVIVGGESGNGAREMKTEWAEGILEQCERYDIAFFMKQLGGVRDKRGQLDLIPQRLRVRRFPNE